MDFISNLSDFIEGFCGQLVLGNGSSDLRTQVSLPHEADDVSTTAAIKFLLADIIH